MPFVCKGFMHFCVSGGLSTAGMLASIFLPPFFILPSSFFIPSDHLNATSKPPQSLLIAKQ
jgi:hypothetical protein